MLKSKILLLLSIIFIGVVVTSCCLTCIITNKELSSFNTYHDSSNRKIVKISSASKTVEVVTSENGFIFKYLLDGKNIFSETSPFYVFNTFIDNNAGIIPLSFTDHCESGLIEPDTVILTDKANRPYSFVRKIRTVKMNLENGSLNVTNGLKNTSLNNVDIAAETSLKLVSNGFLIIPVSIITKFGEEGFKYSGNDKKLVKKNTVRKGDILYINAVPGVNIETDSNTNWFIYIWDDLMLMVKEKKDLRIRSDYKRVRYKLKTDKNSLTVYNFKENKKIKSEGLVTFSEQWLLFKLDKKINTLQKAINYYNKMEMKLSLLTNKVD